MTGTLCTCFDIEKFPVPSTLWVRHREVSLEAHTLLVSRRTFMGGPVDAEYHLQQHQVSTHSSTFKGKEPLTPPGASWTNLRPPGAALAEHHARYLAERGVTPEVAAAAGYWSAWRPSEHPDAFSDYQRRRTPTLIALHLSPDGKTVGYQKRDDRPGKSRDGKSLKWVSPPGDRARPVLSVHPWTADEVREGSGPLFLAEGLTRLHALTGLGIPAVSYAGCWSWQKDGKPLECFEHINLNRRLVYDVPDADARINDNVQQAQERRVAYLESRGARVLVVSVPEVNGDEHAGLDDYLAAGGDLEALKREARPFVRVNVGRERLKKDERLRLGIATLRQNLDALESRKRRECSALSVARYMVEVSATAHGKPLKAGIKVRPSVRQIAAGVRIAVGTVSKALEYLDNEAGFLKMVERAQGPQAASYLLLYPSPGGSEFVEHMREQRGAEKEGQERRSVESTSLETSLSKQESSPSVQQTRGVMKSEKAPEKVPALRNSKLLHTWARKDGRRVVVDSVYVGRYGKKKEAIIRHIVVRGGADETEVHEKFGSRTSRLRDFRRTWITPIVNDGVFVADGGNILPAPDWPDALERVRAQTDEDLDNRLQDAKYADQQRAYRQAKDNPTDQTPELAGPEKVREIVEAARERDQAARVEEQRRKVGTTPETFLADAIQDASGFGWRELRALWIAKGGRPEDLRRAVKDPYRFNREYDGGPLYVERTGATPEPEREPAPVAILREPSAAEEWRSHSLECECVECVAPMPTYARAWSGA